MLSKKEFRFHLDNIENQARWVEYYEGEPELIKVAQRSIDTSKEILLSYFDRKEGDV